MPLTHRRPPELRGRVFRGSRVIADGILTRSELRGSAWRPLFRDIYADAQLVVSHQMRCSAAAHWLLPESAAIAGRSAATWYGGTSAGRDEAIDVLVPPEARFGPAAGLRVHAARVTSGDVVTHRGLPITSPARTCWDLAQWLDVVESVAVIDSLLAHGVVGVSELRDYALRRAGDRGWRRTLRAADLADPGAESPPESRVRVRLVLAGLPRPTTQYVIADDQGRFVARVDLAWPDLKLAVEYDGLWHSDPAQFHRDRQRLNRILGDDWVVLHVTAKRLREDFAGFLAEVRAALRARRARRATR